MAGSIEDQAIAPRLRLARIIWGACLGTLVGYYGILVFLVPRELVGLKPDLAEQFAHILLPVAGGATIFAWFVYRRLAESANAALVDDAQAPRIKPRAEQPALMAYVTCWALGDGIAILGLVAGVLGGPMSTATLFFGWALVLLLLTRPQAVHFPHPHAL